MRILTICIVIFGFLSCSNVSVSNEFDWPDYCPVCDSISIAENNDSVSFDSYLSGDRQGCFIRLIDSMILTGIVNKYSNESVISKGYENEIYVSDVIFNSNDDYSDGKERIIVSILDTTGFYFDVYLADDSLVKIEFLPNHDCKYLEVYILDSLVLKEEGCSVRVPLELFENHFEIRLRALFDIGRDEEAFAMIKRVIYSERILLDQNYFPDERLKLLSSFADSVFSEFYD